MAQESKKSRGRLFYRLLLLLLVVSLGPLGLAGYYMLNLSAEVLKRSTLADQQTLAVGLTDTVYNYVTSFGNVLSETARNEDLQSGDVFKQQAVLNRVLQQHAAFLEMSVIDASGRETARFGRFLEKPKYRDFSRDRMFVETMKSGEYAGSLERFMGQYPMMTISRQIVSKSDKAAGVLSAKLSLSGLSNILKTSFPESSKSQVAVVAPDGFLLAHSDMDLVFKPDAKLPREVLDVLLHNPDPAGRGEILLPGNKLALGAFAEVKKFGWVVYIQKPMAAIEHASEEMLSKTMHALILVMGFVLLLAYVVSMIIIQPIEALREAAIQVGEGNFEDLPDLKMPNNEIGELAHAFYQMSDSLRIKTAELTSAKDELEKLNQSLEARVEARTRELRLALDELIKKERLAAIGQMASVVGHEIRNPLAVINNSTYFIKMKLGANGTVDEKLAKHLGIIESEIQQANGIINEILGFARTRELILKEIRINDYLEDVLSSYPFPAHIELVKTFAPENPSVSIDLEEMKQALRNLVGNAVEVMPERGRLSVATAVEPDGMTRIDVGDTGPGMPKEVQEKIFTPFYTTKARGTGLGLAVVRKVIDRHRGKVKVVSEQGKGTLFSLYIPTTAAAPARPS